MINSLRSGLEMIPMNENETYEEYVLRIANGLNNQNNKG